MKWIFDEFRNAWHQLCRWETWLVIGLIFGFGALSYLVARYAFRTDSLLTFLRLTQGSCRELTNNLIIVMFSGMIFFVFTAVLTLGEVQRYFESRDRRAYADARKAVTGAFAWGITAVLIGVFSLLFFRANCF